MLVYFMTIWSILWLFGLFDGYLVYFPRFGILHQEKSGNPVALKLIVCAGVIPALSRIHQSLTTKAQ
jgi:hypothetical protein